MDIVFVHGYNVTSTNTYGLLPQRLKSLGHTVKDVYLSKYITLDNDLTLPDLIKAFHAALADAFGGNWGKNKFACLTHSTGGLLVRGWITTYYENRMGELPLSHLIMLAPPNHGSRLAGVGKSRLSRIRSLWGIEPGVKILDELDLGSKYQWELNSRWMENGTAAQSGFFPVIITGQWIDTQIWDVIIPATFERGSDGVVRASSANLNMKKFRLSPDGKISSAGISGIPFLIAPKTSHSDERYGIMRSIPAEGEHPVLTAIVRSLAVTDSTSYQTLAARFDEERVDLQKKEMFYDGTQLERHAQLVVRVTDTMGSPLQDYALELVDAERRGDRFPKGFLPHSFRNAVNPEFYTFYLNYDRILNVAGRRVGLKVQSVPHSPLLAYDENIFEGAESQAENFLAPNQTTYLDVVLRRKLNKNVFRITPDLSYQKFDSTPGPDWID